MTNVFSVQTKFYFIECILTGLHRNSYFYLLKNFSVDILIYFYLLAMSYSLTKVQIGVHSEGIRVGMTEEVITFYNHMWGEEDWVKARV